MSDDDDEYQSSDDAEWEANYERQNEEKKRVSNGAGFRAAKIQEPFPVYQNNIMRTYSTWYNGARFGAPPVSEGDALRMKDEHWDYLRPVVAAELGDKVDMGELERGLIEDTTGWPYHLGFDNSFRVGIRHLREVQLEEGSMPIAPAVKFDEWAWGQTLKNDTPDPLINYISWDTLPDNFDEDPREIYKTDGNKSLSLFEFLIWSARVGGFAGQEPNPEWNIEDCTPRAARFSTVEPKAYIPTDWVGRPVSYEEDKERWFWIRKQAQKGEFPNLEQQKTCMETNMKLCSVCYGPPKEGRTDLILCECRMLYWCSEECKEKMWPLHSLDHRVRHSTDVKRTCLSCGKSGGE